MIIKISIYMKMIRSHLFWNVFVPATWRTDIKKQGSILKFAGWRWKRNVSLSDRGRGLSSSMLRPLLCTHNCQGPHWPLFILSQVVSLSALPTLSLMESVSYSATLQQPSVKQQYLWEADWPTRVCKEKYCYTEFWGNRELYAEVY